MSPKISVIVPVYNVEQYLRDCLESLVNQSFSDIEVIIINDGSTDGCQEIIAEYNKYNRFRIFHQENKGLGFTRNRGLELARGKYIAFLDSDDYLPNDAYEKMHDFAESTNADIVIGKVIRFNSHSKKEYSPYGHESVFCDNSPRVTNIEEIPKIIHNGIVANKLFKRDLIKNNNIRFPINVHYEDTFFSLSAFNVSNNIGIIPDFVYYWRIRETDNKSISQRVYSLKNLKDRLYVNQLCDEKIILRNCLQNEWNFFKYHNIVNSFLHDIDQVRTNEKEEYLSTIRDNIKNMPLRYLEKMKIENRIKYICSIMGEEGRINKILERYRKKEIPMIFFGDRVVLQLESVPEEFLPYFDVSDQLFKKRYIEDVCIKRKKLELTFVLTKEVNIIFPIEKAKIYLVLKNNLSEFVFEINKLNNDQYICSIDMREIAAGYKGNKVILKAYVRISIGEFNKDYKLHYYGLKIKKKILMGSSISIIKDDKERMLLIISSIWGSSIAAMKKILKITSIPRGHR